MTLVKSPAPSSTRNSTFETHVDVNEWSSSREPNQSITSASQRQGLSWLPVGVGSVEIDLLRVIALLDIDQASSRMMNYQTLPTWCQYLNNRLAQMSKRAAASVNYPGADVLDRAWKIALVTFSPHCPTPSVLPGEGGSVQFIWHKGGWDVELEVERSGEYVWARNRRTGETWHGELVGLFNQFAELLSTLSTS